MRGMDDVDAMRASLVAAFEDGRAAGDAEAMTAAALEMPRSQQFGAYPGQIPALLHEAYDVLGSCVDLLLPGHSEGGVRNSQGV